MNLRKILVKWVGKKDMRRTKADFRADKIELQASWYIAEFLIQGAIDHTPRIVVKDESGKHIDRWLVGFHSGRNRMLIYLPKGYLEAYSKSIDFDTLGQVSWIESRARILLISYRYLFDFFSIKNFFRVLSMQFQKDFELSTELLHFYSPRADRYLSNLTYWQPFKRFEKLLAWWSKGPRIAVLIEDESQREELAKSVVPADVVINVNDSPTTEAALLANVDYVIPLSRTEHLREASIFMLKRVLKKSKTKPHLIYTDHDYQYDEKPAQQAKPSELLPVFKSQASQCYLHCYNYLGPALVFSSAVLDNDNLADLLNDETRYRLAINCFEDTQKVMHISEAFFHSERQTPTATPQPSLTESPWPNIDWQRRDDYNVLTASPKWQDLPSVDLIIPTRDGLEVLKPCVDSILKLTDYSNFKIIVVDNGSENAATHEYLKHITQDYRVKVVDFPGEFNYSAINNFAVAQGSSEYIALVNNDIEVIHADWLRQMMVWASQSKVGAVGAKLLFGNGLVQHAGVIIGMGNAAGHIHRLEAKDSAGYQQRCLATQNMMAVTAACLVTPRSVFEELGGLDEQSLKVAYNDIDYCLRVEQLGYDIIWTPEAQLYHHESVSRGDDMSEQHIERYFQELGVFQKRWKTKGFVDKYYSRHLRISDEGVYPQIGRSESDELHYVGSYVGS